MDANCNVVRVTLGDAPRQNHLLAALSDVELQRLAPDLELVVLPLGRVLCEADGRLDHAWFPTTCILSTLYDFENGTSVDVAATGKEGLAGISVYMGGGGHGGRIVVRSAGMAYRLHAEPLMREFMRGGSLQSLLLRYTQALFTQVARTTLCHSCHHIEQQLCRALLSSLDRLPTNELETTQATIANTLGVRRESVTAAVGKLRSVGAIRCSRGRITVLDRAVLEAQVCECYATVKAGLARVVPRPASAAPVIVVSRRHLPETPRRVLHSVEGTRGRSVHEQRAVGGR
jgi:hypothetical protein